MFEMATPQWFRQHHSAEFVRFLEASLAPSRASADALAAAAGTVRATPIVDEILGGQCADGNWEPDVPEVWYRSVPRRLEVLLDYGYTLLDEPLARGIRYLLSRQRSNGAFVPDDPDAIPFDEAYNASCLRVLVGAGLREQPATRRAAECLLAGRRHDGGWSTLPVWLRQPGVPISTPEPSCPICTDLSITALGLALDLPLDLRDDFLDRGLTVGDEMPPGARAARWRERLAFMVNQGLRVGDPRVDAAVAGLHSCRGVDGPFEHYESPADFVPSELAEVRARHLLWRVGARSSGE